MNWYIVILASMLFCHVLDDYVLQAPCLSNLKQKKWWQVNAPDDKYRYDYLVGLLMHSISWGSMIMLPIVLSLKGQLDELWFMLPTNIIIHAVVDDAKANKNKLNLIQDQLIHLLQILGTWILLIIFLEVR